jgi:hypothetical protein
MVQTSTLRRAIGAIGPLALLALLAVLAALPAAAATSGAERTLALVKAWVHGHYDNKAQFDRDVAANLPPEKIHRQMHQFFAPIDVQIPGIDGYLVYQHASADGSLDPDVLFRVGLLQYLTDPASGKLIQRELMFKDAGPWKNAHLRPELLRRATLADFNVNPGCDFHLAANAEGSEIRGVMQEKACTLYSPGIKMTLYAQDAVLIRANEYGFWGRFVDDSGKVRWGTESEELYQLFRVSAP